MTTDQQTLVDQLIAIGEGWLAPRPPDLAHQDPMPERLNGAIHSLLVNLEGSGAIDPHRVSPKGRPDVDVVARPIHGQWLNAIPSTDETQTLFIRFAAALRRAMDTRGERRDVMGGFLADLCRVLEDGYEVVPQLMDDMDTQIVEEEGDDVAPGLVAAFQTAWAARG